MARRNVFDAIVGHGRLQETARVAKGPRVDAQHSSRFRDNSRVAVRIAPKSIGSCSDVDSSEHRGRPGAEERARIRAISSNSAQRSLGIRIPPHHMPRHGSDLSRGFSFLAHPGRRSATDAPRPPESARARSAAATNGQGQVFSRPPQAVNRKTRQAPRLPSQFAVPQWRQQRTTGYQASSCQPTSREAHRDETPPPHDRPKRCHRRCTGASRRGEARSYKLPATSSPLVVLSSSSQVTERSKANLRLPASAPHPSPAASAAPPSALTERTAYRSRR